MSKKKTVHFCAIVRVSDIFEETDPKKLKDYINWNINVKEIVYNLDYVDQQVETFNSINRHNDAFSFSQTVRLILNENDLRGSGLSFTAETGLSNEELGGVKYLDFSQLSFKKKQLNFKVSQNSNDLINNYVEDVQSPSFYGENIISRKIQVQTYVIIRLDSVSEWVNSTNVYEHVDFIVNVKKNVFSPDYAQQEVERLNKLKGHLGDFYFWQPTYLILNDEDLKDSGLFFKNTKPDFSN